MTSSAKKKKEKKKDFQKSKLKVGKARPKATNHTDTSFKTKAIAVADQSLKPDAPSLQNKFEHHVSLLSSRSDSQRKESLSFMTTIISSQPVDQPFPVTPGYLLPKLLPLISDGSNGVRTQLVKLLQALPRDGIDFYSEQILLYTRAGMTHLAVDIRRCSLDVLDWAIEVCGKELVECPGGWVKMIKNFLAMLGWTSIDANSRWSSEWSLSNNDRITAKTLGTLAAFLELGFVDEITTEQVAREEADLARKWFPLRQVWCHMIPTKSHAYRHLNLFGAPRDEESEIYGDVEARQQSFRKYRVAFEKGLEMVKRAGGEIGRAGARTAKVIAEGMKDAPNDDREEIFSAYRRKGCKSAYQLCQEMYAS